MINEPLIIGAIIFAVAAVVSFKLLKGFVKVLVFLIAAASILIGVASAMIYLDAKELKENLGKEPTLLILASGDKALMALSFEAGREPKLANQQQTDDYSEQLANKDYRAIKGDYYKAVIIDEGLLRELSPENNSKLPKGIMEAEAIALSEAVRKITSEPIILVTQYKKGNIRIYDETPAFKAIKLAPTSLIKAAAEKLMAKTTAAVKKIED